MELQRGLRVRGELAALSEAELDGRLFWGLDALPMLRAAGTCRPALSTAHRPAAVGR